MTLINYRINMLEVCICLLKKKKEFPIFKIISDILLSFIRSISDKLNFLQLIKLFEIFSKDDFILFYDNNFFALYFSERLFSEINKFILNDENKNDFQQTKLTEVLTYMEKLNLFNLNINNLIYITSKDEIILKNEKISYKDKLFIIDFIENILNFMKLVKLHGNITRHNHLIITLLEVLKYKNYNLLYSNSKEKSEILMLEKFNLQKFIFKNYLENNFKEDLDNLYKNKLNDFCILSILDYNIFYNFDNFNKRNESFNDWDNYINNECLYFDFKNFNEIFFNLLNLKINDKISLTKSLNMKKNSIVNNKEDKYFTFEDSKENYLHTNFNYNSNKILVKIIIFWLFHIMRIPKNLIEKSLIKLDNLEFLYFLNTLEEIN